MQRNKNYYFITVFLTSILIIIFIQANYLNHFSKTKKIINDNACNQVLNEGLDETDLINRQKLNTELAKDNNPNAGSKEFKTDFIDDQNITDINEKNGNYVSSNRNSIKYSEINGSKFKGYLLEVSDPTRVSVGVSNYLNERGQTTSELAKQIEAVAAINGGGFEAIETGRSPMGVVIHNGNFLVGEDVEGPVDLVGINDKGMLVAGCYNIEEIKNLRLKEGVTFGPPLILDGKKMFAIGDGGYGVAPRTAIGQREDGTILLLVIDGNQPGYSIGATIVDVQNSLFEKGAFIAANLDGGASATMYYNGEVVNRPLNLWEREIPTAFVVR